MQADCAAEIDADAYSVPWRLIGETERATIADGIHEVVVHPICVGRRRRVVDPKHFEGPTDFKPSRVGELALSYQLSRPPPPTLLRPLGEYEAIVGGGF